MQVENRNSDVFKRQILEFIEDERHSGKYIERIKRTVEDGKFRLIVDLNDLRYFDGTLTNRLVLRPREYMVAIQEASMELVPSIDPTLGKLLKSSEIQVGFEGSLGINATSPRGLSASRLNQLVEVEGIITKVSSIKPKLVKAVQYCEKTSTYTSREYRDNTSLDVGIEVKGRERLPTGSVIPTKDADGNPLEFEFGLSTFKNYQKVTIQEMPERSKVGQLPRSVEAILEYDLADKVKPGDRVQCVGVYRPLPSTQMGQTSGVFKDVLISNNISILGKEVGAVHVTGPDVSNIKEVGRQKDVLQILARSLCPSIFGHEFVKIALILQLLGGNERILENKGHLRGDINVLLIGDPSTAKSQLLRSIMDIAPLAISTTGRGSSGVGLTAAVTMDSDSRERRLEAGAMVLADRGIVCIDEFDKMSEVDRVAIHEVMEQQTVTIAKAAIHASLNARCSVLAAANPTFGQYDRTKRPQENIGLPDSLLSRFDLTFIILDQLDPTTDKRLSEHILKSHQYRRAGNIMEPEPLNQKAKLELDTFDKNVETPKYLNVGNNEILHPEFLRKYIHFAKNRKRAPELSEEAMDTIANAYRDMRQKQNGRTLPVTARTLETMIRLSSASAKARLSMSVDVFDVEIALELLNFVYFHEIGVDPSSDISNTLKGNPPPSSSSGMNKENFNDNNAVGSKRSRDESTKMGSEQSQHQSSSLFKDLNDDDDDDDDMNNITLSKKYAISDLRLPSSANEYDFDIDSFESVPVDRSSPRYLLVKGELSKYESTVTFTDFFDRMNSIEDLSAPFDRKELASMLREVEQENKITFYDGIIELLL